MLTEFNGQPIRQEKLDGKTYISLTDCLKATNNRSRNLDAIIQSESFKELEAEIVMSEKWLSLALDFNNITIDENGIIIEETDKLLNHYILTIKGNSPNNKLPQGKWLNIADEIGQELLIEIAQALLPSFRRWCNKHIRSLMVDGYTINENATSTQLAKAEAKILKLQADKQKFKILAKRQERELLRMLPAHLEQQELKARITNEKELNDAMHLLQSRLCKAYYAEFSIATSLGLARFDSVRKTAHYTEIIEYKLGQINYKIADKQLFGKKQYLAKIQEYFGDKPVIFRFMSPLIDDEQMAEFIDEKQYLFGDNFQIEYCQLDDAYFRHLKNEYCRIFRASGLNFNQINEAWKSANCDELVHAILALR